MKCDNVQEKIKNNIKLDEKDLFHLKNCEKCKKFQMDNFENTIKITGEIFRNITSEKKVSKDFRKNLLSKVKDNVKRKFSILNKYYVGTGMFFAVLFMILIIFSDKNVFLINKDKIISYNIAIENISENDYFLNKVKKSANTTLDYSKDVNIRTSKNSNLILKDIYKNSIKLSDDTEILLKSKDLGFVLEKGKIIYNIELFNKKIRLNNNNIKMLDNSFGIFEIRKENEFLEIEVFSGKINIQYFDKKIEIEEKKIIRLNSQINGEYVIIKSKIEKNIKNNKLFRIDN